MLRYGMGQAIGLLGQSLLNQAAAEEARKDKEAMLQESLQQRREAALLNAQTQLGVAQQNAEAKKADIDKKKLEFPYGAKPTDVAPAMAIYGGFNPNTTRDALSYYETGTLPADEEKATAALALATSKSFGALYAQVTRTGADYDAFQKGSAANQRNTAIESAVKRGAPLDEIAKTGGAFAGEAMYDAYNGRYDGKLTQAGQARLNNELAVARSGGGANAIDPLTKFILQSKLQEQKDGASAERMGFQTAHRTAVKAASDITGQLNKDVYLRTMDALGFPDAQLNGVAPQPSVPGLLNRGVNPSPESPNFGRGR